MDVRWKIREFQESDRADYIEWRKLVAHREKSSEFIEWEYYSCPYGPVKTWVADDGGKIVGQYSLQRYDCYYFGAIIRASLCFDVATHPDYRFQGMFTKLGFHSLEQEGKDNVAFTVGFPWEGGIAIPGHMRVGWKQLGNLSIYAKTDFATVYKTRSQDIGIIEIHRFDNQFDALVEEHKTDIPIMLRRTAAYLNWRYLDKVGYRYYCYQVLNRGCLVGYFILKVYESEGSKTVHIIDFMLPKSQDVYRDVLCFVVEFASRIGARKVNLVINENHHFFGFLERNGFSCEKRHFIPIVHRNNDSVDDLRLMDYKNHHFTFGDIDIF